jgi:hypothetical protein
MNLFILSSNPTEAAEAHADKHVVKMILEACQMLYSAHWVCAYPELLENKSAVAISRAQKLLDLPPSLLKAPTRGKDAKEQGLLPNPQGCRGYRPVHLHHPCTKWIRASLENYMWACDLAIAIGLEFTFRYGKIHACQQHAEWLRQNPPFLPSLGLQTFAIAMKTEYKISDDPIECYHHYYRTSKEERGLLQYTRREKPAFL